VPGNYIHPNLISLETGNRSVLVKPPERKPLVPYTGAMDDVARLLSAFVPIAGVHGGDVTQMNYGLNRMVRSESMWTPAGSAFR
jgi:hypothetical protein